MTRHDAFIDGRHSVRPTSAAARPTTGKSRTYTTDRLPNVTSDLRQNSTAGPHVDPHGPCADRLHQVGPLRSTVTRIGAVPAVGLPARGIVATLIS